jgi:hypothetical protein
LNSGKNNNRWFNGWSLFGRSGHNLLPAPKDDHPHKSFWFLPRNLQRELIRITYLSLFGFRLLQISIIDAMTTRSTTSTRFSGFTTTAHG